jgi:glutamine phosphoribosylpyrophosphate amidotransferase
MGDFHRQEVLENAEFGVPLEVQEEMGVDAMTYLSLHEWDAYISALQGKQRELTEEYNTAIAKRKEMWQAGQQPV